MNHYIYRKLSALDFHPSQHLGEVCERIRQLGNNIPYQPTARLPSCFLPSSCPMNQQLHFRLPLSTRDTASAPICNTNKHILSYPWKKKKNQRIYISPSGYFPTPLFMKHLGKLIRRSSLIKLHVKLKRYQLIY